MYKGKLVSDESVELTERQFHGEFDDAGNMVIDNGLTQEFNLRSLRDGFPVIQELSGHLLITDAEPRLTDTYGSTSHESFVDGFKLSDIEAGLEGYVELETLEVTMPLHVATQVSEQDRKDLIGFFIYEMLDMDIDKVKNTKGFNYVGVHSITLPNDDPQYAIDVIRTLINPDVVSHIEDRCTHRVVHYDQSKTGYKPPEYTVSSVEDLERAFGQSPEGLKLAKVPVSYPSPK